MFPIVIHLSCLLDPFYGFCLSSDFHVGDSGLWEVPLDPVNGILSLERHLWEPVSHSLDISSLPVQLTGKADDSLLLGKDQTIVDLPTAGKT